jgi:hypothetical protein
MTTQPQYPQRPHDTGSLVGALVVAVIVLCILLILTN